MTARPLPFADTGQLQLSSRPYESGKTATHHLFDLYAQLPEQFTATEFTEKALVLHTAITELHARSPSHTDPRLPVKIIVHGYPELGRSRNSVFAELDRSTEELASVLCLGTYEAKRNMYHPSCYYQNGVVVTDEAYYMRLVGLYGSRPEDLGESRSPPRPIDRSLPLARPTSGLILADTKQ
jgi:hypothetical protein